jgi:hypothetical protein
MLIAILYWPDDKDRGQEVYGKPSWTEAERNIWMEEVLSAADAGDPLLGGVHFILDKLNEPFEVRR